MWATLAAGISIAAYIAVSAGAWSLFATAAVSGLVGAIVIVRFLRREKGQESAASR